MTYYNVLSSDPHLSHIEQPDRVCMRAAFLHGRQLQCSVLYPTQQTAAENKDCSRALLSRLWCLCCACRVGVSGIALRCCKDGRDLATVFSE